MFDNNYAVKLQWGRMYDTWSTALDAMVTVDETLDDIPMNEPFKDHAEKLYEMSKGLVASIFELETMIDTRNQQIDGLSEMVRKLQKGES